MKCFVRAQVCAAIAAVIAAAPNGAIASCGSLAFPRADGAHLESRGEWWRVFAHLKTTSGERYDVAVTFARFANGDVGRDVSRDGVWAAPHVMPADAIVVDSTRRRATFGHRLERDAVGLAHAALDRLDTSVGDWSIRSEGGIKRGASRRIRLHIAFDETVVDLEQRPVKAPVGYDASPGCAYAYTRLTTRGVLKVAGATLAVTGDSWLDHEYTSRTIAESDVPFEHFGIQFDDGRELMLRARDDAGGGPLQATGVIVAADGSARRIGSQEGSIENPLDTQFASPVTQLRYPSLWELIVSSAHLDLAAVPPVQNLEIPNSDGTGGTYLGPIDVENASLPEGSHGRGFVEVSRRRPAPRTR